MTLIVAAGADRQRLQLAQSLPSDMEDMPMDTGDANEPYVVPYEHTQSPAWQGVGQAWKNGRDATVRTGLVGAATIAPASIMGAALSKRAGGTFAIGTSAMNTTLRVTPALAASLFGPAVADGLSYLAPNIVPKYQVNMSPGDRDAIRIKRGIAAGALTAATAGLVWLKWPQVFNKVGLLRDEALEMGWQANRMGFKLPNKKMLVDFGAKIAPITVFPAFQSAYDYYTITDAAENVLDPKNARKYSSPPSSTRPTPRPTPTRSAPAPRATETPPTTSSNPPPTTTTAESSPTGTN